MIGSIALTQNLYNGLSTKYRLLIKHCLNNSKLRPTTFYQVIGDSLMRQIVSASLDSILLFWYEPGSSSRDFGKLNWLDAASFELQEVGTLTFSTGGFTGDATTGALNSQWTPSTQGGALFVQNDATIAVHVGSYDAAEDRMIFGVRNSAATSQISATVRGVTASNATSYTFNDNTNQDVTGNVASRGMYVFNRINSTTKNLIRRLVTSSNGSVNTVALPNAPMAFLARWNGSTSTYTLFSSAMFSWAIAGRELTTLEADVAKQTHMNYWLAAQRPLFRATGVGRGIKFLYGIGSAGQWDEGSVFGSTVYDHGGVKFDYYAGTDDSSGDPVGYSIGAFDYTDLYSGTKDASNPILDISTLSPYVSVFPMDVLIVGSVVYVFVTLRRTTNQEHDTGVIVTSTSDPKDLSAAPSIILTGSSAGFSHHAFRIVRDHPDTDYWYATYGHKNNTADPYKVDLIRCLRANDLTNSANWSSVATDLIQRPSNVVSTANLGQVYTFCYYDTVFSNYKLWYGRFFPERGEDAFSLFTTQASSLGNQTFPVGKETLWPSGNDFLTYPDNADSGYTSLPYLDRANKLVYYSGRQLGGGSPYLARFVKKYREEF